MKGVAGVFTYLPTTRCQGPTSEEVTFNIMGYPVRRLRNA